MAADVHSEWAIMSPRGRKPASPLKDCGPKQEPISFEIAEVLQSGKRRPAKEDAECREDSDEEEFVRSAWRARA